MPKSKIPSFIPGVTITSPRVETKLRGGTITSYLHLRDPAPCVTILVHGVNDVGEAYPTQEAGICEGLNQRLDRDDLAPGQYRLPKNDRSDKLDADPDAAYYQRGLDDQLSTPVIPFYWGFREEEKLTDVRHGQKTDRFGNRLDARGIKQGGPFANATTSIPDMWGEGMETTLGGLLNAYKNIPTTPLLKCPPRHYMVLAAKRLAMLIGLIRDAHEADAVNLILHSQGCNIGLLAQAFLQAEGKRPADCLILNHPCYSLHAPWAERFDLGDLQQTVGARLDTLVNLVNLATAKPQSKPAFGGKGYYREKDWESGSVRDWRTQDAKTAPAEDEAYALYNPDGQSAWLRRVEGVGPQALPAGQHFAICGRDWRAEADRDNRGKVYLYFCPEDATVGLKNVQGIGWQGVPDTMRQIEVDTAGLAAYGATQDTSYLSATQTRTAPLARLGSRFKQRVFTWRQRGDKTVKVGQAPHAYTLCTPQEVKGFWHANASFTAAAPVNQTRKITGEALPKPCEAKPGSAQLAVGPIDAAIAITNRGIRTLPRETIADPRPLQERGYNLADERAGRRLNETQRKRLEDLLNAGIGKAEDKRAVVDAIAKPNYGKTDGTIDLQQQESPNEARKRWQSQEFMANSYHSTIVEHERHSREVTAYDLAIAPSYTVSNREFFEFLCLVADWRVGVVASTTEVSRLGSTAFPAFEKSKWMDKSHTKKFFREINPAYQQLIRDTYHYANTGILPASILNCPIPPGVVSETRAQAKKRGGK